MAARAALVLGAGGALGRALRAELGRRGWRVSALGRAECDVTDPDAVARAIDRAEPQAVFNAAAYNAVDRAEAEPELAWRVNAEAPGILARACETRGVPLLHYSTDFVFDGKKPEPYLEDDATGPLGRYAASKLGGERAVLEGSPRAAVARTAWLYGEGGRNFPSSIARRLLAGESVRAERDRRGSPTWVVPLAGQSIEIVERGVTGVVHAVCDGTASWLEFARLALEALGLPSGRVSAVTTSELGLPVARPAQSVLECARLKQLGIYVMPRWDVAARAYLASQRPPA